MEPQSTQFQPGRMNYPGCRHSFGTAPVRGVIVKFLKSKAYRHKHKHNNTN
ncbi:hypothetical protein PROFUN_04406 [Planoprotostelium fungivorum]|uniref:Uncharacterized protein n=1 Tax=Planoprotostelium fungivorum TaxID=1890364 RepID=A0A2P6NHX3_9EUKA|nr:hypothetical protein PROFUN_04406 [Planoprotostelium fungivorum]